MSDIPVVVLFTPVKVIGESVITALGLMPSSLVSAPERVPVCVQVVTVPRIDREAIPQLKTDVCPIIV